MGKSLGGRTSITVGGFLDGELRLLRAVRCGVLSTVDLSLSGVGDLPIAWETTAICSLIGERS